MNMYVDSFDDDELEIVLDDSEGIEVVLDSTAITWSEINGDITKNKSVVEFLNNLPMLPDIPVEGEHRLKAVEGEALWEEDNLATRDELSLAKEELQADIDTKQIKGDYALKSELPDVTPYATNEALATAKEELQADIDTKQDKGNYALKSEIPSITHLATKTEVESADKTLTEAIAKLDADKQDKGDYAVKSELTPLATKVELNTTSQALQKNIDGKQDKGDYALKSQIPDVSGYATKTQLTEGLNNKQDKGDYITKTLYDQTNEAFQNALNGKQNTGDYVTNTELENKKYLTSFTEKDPIYLADKPNLALKSELPDLTPYATKEELTSGLAGKQETGDYALKSEIPSLTDYVKNTDYATASKGGVVKQSSTYGSGIANGFLYAAPKTLEGYTSASDNIFIGKGTLENIKDDYVKRGLTDNQVELTEEELAKIKAYLKFADNTDILTAIASIPQFKFSIVSNLPETGEKMTLYLVPKTGADNDVHNEYVWIEEESKYEYIGTTAVDLTDYVKKTDYAQINKAGLIMPTSYFGLNVDSQGSLHATSYTAEQLKAKSEYTFIAKGTLENIKDNYVKEAITTNDITLTDNEKASARTWLGAGSQADLDTKADDSTVVHLAGNETITGVKSFTSPDNIRFTASKTAGYKPAISNAQTGLTPAINVPWSRNGWHDHFAFGQSFTIASKEVTTDGESWVADDRDISYLFAQKEYGATGETVQAPNAGEMGFRFVLQGSNIAYSNIQWIEIGFSYSSAHTVRLLVESSSDGTEWTEVHNSTTSASANYQYLYVGNLSSGNTYLRISVIKIDTSSLDVVTRMLYVKGWTYRKGNQGRGIEYEYPYFWDNIPNLMPVKSGNNLGSTTRRWGTTYTTNLNVGGQVLNHTHITKLDNLPTTVVLTQAEYDALETKDANTLYLIEEE